MSYSERAYAGPDWTGRTFPAEPCHHMAAREDHHRLQRAQAQLRTSR